MNEIISLQSRLLSVGEQGPELMQQGTGEEREVGIRTRLSLVSQLPMYMLRYRGFSLTSN